MLYLKKANREDAEQEWRFVRDMPEEENGVVNSWHGISREEFEAKALPGMLRMDEGRDLPDWKVPETTLFLWKDGEIVGQFRVRHYLNDALREGAGHIGYFVAEKYRGKGFATEGLRLALEYAVDLIPEDEVYLRIRKDNPVSLRAALHNGGRIVGEKDGRCFVRIKKPDKRYH